MKRALWSVGIAAATASVVACEPRDPDEPVDAVPPAEAGNERPVATTRAASQPPAVPIEEQDDERPDSLGNTP